MQRPWSILLLGVALLASGCSGDDGASTTTTGPTTTERVRAVSQNILHGIACPADSQNCDLPARVELFTRQLDDAGCPELVGLQEANQGIVDLLRQRGEGYCDGAYEIVWDGDPGVDREVVLTTLPVLGSRRDDLAGPLRTAFWVRVAADIGIVDFVTTHLASSSDDRPCDAQTCPPPCPVDDSVNTCQARQVLALVEEVADPAAIVLVGGDLNAQPPEPTLDAFRAAGFVDTHLVAGNAECDPTSGARCTSGRIDDSLADLTNPSSIQTERIDYLWLGGERDCTVVDPTGLFNAEPAEDGPGGLAFPSDHTAVQAIVECTTTPAQRAAADDAPLATPPTTTAPEGGELDADTAAAITTAFETLFNGDVSDPETKLAVLQDAEALRPFFLESLEANRAIASRIRVRIDEMQRTAPDTAAVTYSLLLDDAAVIDRFPGEAVLVDDIWKVSRRTYCDVSTQGASAIPEPCR